MGTGILRGEMRLQGGKGARGAQVSQEGSGEPEGPQNLSTASFCCPKRGKHIQAALRIIQQISECFSLKRNPEHSHQGKGILQEKPGAKR